MTDKQHWPMCDIHTQSFDGDCEYCVAEMDGKQAALAQMHESIGDTNTKLHQMTGTPYLEVSSAVPSLKADIIVAMIFSDPKHRMAYELNYANALKEQISFVHQQMIRAQLTGSMPGPQVTGISPKFI